MSFLNNGAVARRSQYVPFEGDHNRMMRRKHDPAEGYNGEMVISYSKDRGAYHYQLPDRTSNPKSLRPRGKYQNGVYIHDIPVPVHLNSKLDQKTKVRHLKTKLLTGHNVTHSQINIVAYGDKAQRRKNKEIEKQIQMTDSAILHSPPLDKEPLYIDKGIIGIPTPHKPGPLKNSFGSPHELRVSLNGVDTIETLQRYRFFVDMAGFEDEEITFTLQGRKLLVCGERLKTEQANAKVVSEVVHLPPDLQVDNLRAVRDYFGTIILEEAWKF